MQVNYRLVFPGQVPVISHQPVRLCMNRCRTALHSRFFPQLCCTVVPWWRRKPLPAALLAACPAGRPRQLRPPIAPAPTGHVPRLGRRASRLVPSPAIPITPCHSAPRVPQTRQAGIPLSSLRASMCARGALASSALSG
jgi:hypothetical protein